MNIFGIGDIFGLGTVWNNLLTRFFRRVKLTKQQRTILQHIRDNKGVAVRRGSFLSQERTELSPDIKLPFGTLHHDIDVLLRNDFIKQKPSEIRDSITRTERYIITEIGSDYLQNNT